MNNAPICLYLHKGGKISLTIEGPIRLFIDVRSLRKMLRKRVDDEESQGVFDTLRKGMSGLSSITSNPLVKAALTKFVPFGGMAVTAVSAANSAMQLGQRKLAQLPKTTSLVQNALRDGPVGDNARAQVLAIKTRADNGDATAAGQVRAMIKVATTLNNMGKLARIGQ